MVELSTFIGQIVSDLASARTNADYYAAGISEQYHADPFVKNLPIPHYMIEEAEIEVPVMVVGISKNSELFENEKAELLEIIKTKLPILLLRSYKFNYVREREQARDKDNEKKKADNKLLVESNKSVDSNRNRIDVSKFDFSDEVIEEFNASVEKLTERLIENTTSYMDNYNYEIIKILDMSDDFTARLQREIKADMRGYKKENRPYLSEETISRAANYVGNLMFFEFKKILRSTAAVQVDVNTVQMNEYASRDCLMHIKLKLKEQDLTLMVEAGENKEKRYLSLT